MEAAKKKLFLEEIEKIKKLKETHDKAVQLAQETHDDRAHFEKVNSAVKELKALSKGPVTEALTQSTAGVLSLYQGN